MIIALLYSVNIDGEPIFILVHTYAYIHTTQLVHKHSHSSHTYVRRHTHEQTQAQTLTHTTNHQSIHALIRTYKHYDTSTITRIYTFKYEPKIINKHPPNKITFTKLKLFIVVFLFFDCFCDDE